MAKMKIVFNARPYRVESGDDVGIALQVIYTMVEPAAADAGCDLFDQDQLELFKRDFISLNERWFTCTIEPHAMKQWSRVFAEFKDK